ncbi:hypothetical protein ACFQS2_07030 [Brachybacterium sp. GCM10030267]|uniref:Rv0361 family membrane protein n=1 Tax=unclassified Brachybacterium TaxID=2623841 RepID=UPI003622C6C1
MTMPGSPYGPPPATPGGPAVPAAGGRGGSRRRVWWIVGGCSALAVAGIALIIAAVLVWALLLRATPQETVENYYEAWETRDCQGYLDSVTDRYREENGVTCEDVEAEHPRDVSEDEFEIRDVTVDGDAATVQAYEEFTDQEGTRISGVAEFDLVRQDGDWLIDGVRIVEDYEPV